MIVNNRHCQMLPSPPPRPLSSPSRASSEYTVAIAKHSANSEYTRASSGEYIVASGSACTAARSSSEGEEMTQLIELREQLRVAEQDIALAKEVLQMERANLTSEKKKWALDRNVEDQRWAEEIAQISRREKSIWGAKGKDSHLAFQKERAKWDQERKSMMEKHRLELDDIMNLLINSEVLKAADGPAKRELERRSHEEQQRQHSQEALDLMSLLKSADDQKAALALAAENERKWEQERERLNCKIAELRVALANRLEVNFSQQTDLDRQLREAMERESKLHEDLRLHRQQSEEDCR